MYRRCAILVFCFFVATGHAKENVLNSLSFESGKMMPNAGYVDAGFISTLPDPQSGTEAIRTGQGGCGPTSNCDMRVVRSERVGGQDIKSRAGDFFLRMVLDKSKDYSGLNGGADKPRNSLSFGNDVYRFDHDVEEWLGFSVFLPNNYEDETENVGMILTEITTDSSAQFLKLVVGMRSGDKESHWYFRYKTSDTSTTSATETIVDLGSIAPDKGKWTDFVIRTRSNPFSVDTNPAKLGINLAKDLLFEGDRGILQVWKSEGPVLDAANNRKMVNKINKVNTPIGLVPGTTQGKDKISHSIRAYKPGWQGHTGTGTSVKGPIWIGWDEVRFGEAERHGTGYRDVHPTGLSCTEKCPADSKVADGTAPPAPPSGLRLDTGG